MLAKAVITQLNKIVFERVSAPFRASAKTIAE
jgi:hypothetical protein